ncbi:MAG TPA: TonB family protein [bacterium]|nr:TonB family protein [bacterium]HRQ69188.1 TonB family protein [bacterium]
MNSDRIFALAVILSIIFHGVLIASKTDLFKESSIVTTTKILLNFEEPPPAPPPPPPPPPKPKPKPKIKKEHVIEKPEELREEITDVASPSDGLRMAEMVDAKAGRYEAGIGKPEEPQKPAEKKVDTKKILSEYTKKVNTEIARNKIYPSFAQRYNIEGVVKISFLIDTDGTFKEIKITKSSGQEILDEAAFESVKKSSGRIKKPVEIGHLKIKRNIIIRYELTNS